MRIEVLVLFKALLSNLNRQGGVSQHLIDSNLKKGDNERLSRIFWPG